MRNQSFRRKVRSIINGDTFRVYRPIQGSSKVRIAGFNAPELDQRGGFQAKKALQDKIRGKIVTIHPVGRSYDRVVGEVFFKRRNRW